MLTNQAIAFATNFDIAFRTLTKGKNQNEISLFRYMHEALTSLSAKFEIEEYHGTSKQVTFTGNGSYVRSKARCELSDLMIITYSSIDHSVRLTYLQAKFERISLPTVCNRKFIANLEQWYLLANRPLITGIGNFTPPSDLLASALLPSVGSFAFFYKDGAGEFQTYYATANYMVPAGKYTQKYGKLQAKGPCKVKNKTIYADCLAACGNKSFAESLFRMEIGTPIHRSVAQALPTRNWIAANLRTQILERQKTETPSKLARELIEILSQEEDKNLSYSFGAKRLIIIKSSIESDKRFDSQSC